MGYLFDDFILKKKKKKKDRWLSNYLPYLQHMQRETAHVNPSSHGSGWKGHTNS